MVRESDPLPRKGRDVGRVWRGGLGSSVGVGVNARVREPQVVLRSAGRATTAPSSVELQRDAHWCLLSDNCGSGHDRERWTNLQDREDVWFGAGGGCRQRGDHHADVHRREHTNIPTPAAAERTRIRDVRRRAAPRADPGMQFEFQVTLSYGVQSAISAHAREQ